MTTKQPMHFFFGANSPLSNWHVAPFTVNGVSFHHVEQFMMYCKACLFGDVQVAEKILATASPMEAKRLGRTVRGFDEGIWNEHRENYVLRGALEKFRNHPGKKAFLLSTHGSRLVEAAPNDRIWGVGLGVDDPRIHDPSKWPGRNLLGSLLERARDILEKE